MKMETLQDLLIDQLKDLYDAEHQITEALPKMAQTASSQQLKDAFNTHLRETQGQIQRLEQVFDHLGQRASRKTCKAMEGLVREGEEMIREQADPDVKDAGLIAAAQRIEHYEIAGYGTARAYAQRLGKDHAVQLLQQTLDEEGQTDKKLTQLAESSINIQAAQ